MSTVVHWTTRAFTALLVFVYGSLGQSASYRVVERGSISVPSPAFQSLSPFGGVDGKPALLISSFRLSGVDRLYRLADPAAAIRGERAQVELLTDSIVWPNEARSVSAGDFGADGFLIGSGFLFAPKSTGAIRFLDVAGRLTDLTRERRGWFYHRAVPVDLCGCGRIDVVTTRAKVPMVGGADGELVWLQRPTNPFAGPWEEVVLARGPDMHFRLERDPLDGSWVVLAAEFSGRRISLHWIDPAGQRVESRVIDDTLGAAFDLELVDINADGRPELLATNHENRAEKSAVFAYEIPLDMRRGQWLRHTLLSGIETRQPGIGQASPGAAKAFHPELARASNQVAPTKPWIVVSGDGSQRAYLLEPESEAATDWRYRSTEFMSANSTIGEPLVSDFDGDGLADISIPVYDLNRVRFFSFQR